MKYIYILFIILGLIISSCNVDKKNQFTKFKEQYSLKGNVVNLPLFFKNGMVNVFDSLIILLGTPENTRCIHIFNKNTFKHIASSGIIGRGPSEILVPGNAAFDTRQGIIWYRDLGYQKIWEFPLSDILKNQYFRPTESVPLPKNLFFTQFFYNKDKGFSFINPKDNILISFFDSTGRVIEKKNITDKLEVYKKLNKNPGYVDLTYIYAPNPGNTRFIIAYRYADVVSLIDTVGNVIWQTRGPDNINQTPDYKDPSLIIANNAVVANDRLIFSMYSGRQASEEKNGKMEHNYSKQIHIYDWEGHPLTQIMMEYTATWFDYDADHNRIITLSPETGGFVYYDLPKLFY